MSDTPRTTEELAQALENEIIGAGLHLSLGQFQIVEEAAARLREQEQQIAAARAEGAREAQLVVTAQCPHCGAYHDHVEIERKS